MGKSRSQIRKLKLAFDGICAYCRRPCIDHDGRLFDRFDHLAEWRKPTLDHATPKTRGGARFGPNAVLSCLACNHIKGDMTSDEYRHFLAAGELHPKYIAFLTGRLKNRAIAHGIQIGTGSLDTILKIVPQRTS
jgi:5-methylcytosine-specific restriction endonuclease McrA